LTDCQRHVLASNGYLELGMFDAAALMLEEIAPEDKNRNEVLDTRINLYKTARKWEMAAVVANHLVQAEHENSGWWIDLAYATRRYKGVKSAEAILVRASGRKYPQNIQGPGRRPHLL
jgi:lipopolysaccharide biosynthesis regulator YciM